MSDWLPRPPDDTDVVALRAAVVDVAQELLNVGTVMLASDEVTRFGPTVLSALTEISAASDEAEVEAAGRVLCAAVTLTVRELGQQWHCDAQVNFMGAVLCLRRRLQLLDNATNNMIKEEQR